MFTYLYNAKDNGGAVIDGQLQAESRQAAISTLKQKGYYPVTIEPQSRIAALIAQGPTPSGRIKTKQRAIFTHQLATLLKAGLRITDALETLSKQTENKHLSVIIAQLREDIEQSCSLSEAMAKHPRVFSQIYTAIVASAEQSGALSETLAVLAKQLRSQASIQGRIKSAMMYPIFLLFVSTMVVTVLMVFVIPKFITLFIDAQQTLPMPTRILICVSGALKSYWWMIVAVIAGVVCLFAIALKNRQFRLWFDAMLLKLPIIGDLNRKLQLAGFARTLGSLLNGGVQILSAVKTTRNITSNSAFGEDIGRIERGIVDGASLAKCISQQDCFSEMMANMVAVGEDTGMLPEMLLEVADMYDEESESAIGAVTTLLGPMMIVAMGLLVGFVVMAILLPIFETSTMIN